MGSIREQMIIRAFLDQNGIKEVKFRSSISFLTKLLTPKAVQTLYCCILRKRKKYTSFQYSKGKSMTYLNTVINILLGKGFLLFPAPDTQKKNLKNVTI